MKILFISPVAKPINPQTRYLGIERLVWEYARELSKTNEVAVIGHRESIYPMGVTHYFSETEGLFDPELRSFQANQYIIKDYDVIHDFSHLHLASRFMPNLPSLNIFWHAPALAQYPKAPYNIIALSEWAAREFRRVYRQEARYHQSIVIDPDKYKPVAEPIAERLITIGRNGPEKGNLNAMMLAQKAGVPIDVMGARGLENIGKPLTDYEKAVHSLCDGKQIKEIGEVSEADKINYMQNCRALLYATDHPEVTSHKIQEVLFCGRPVIVPRLGALPEIVTEGFNGYLCSTEDEYLWSINNIDRLSLAPSRYNAIIEKYSVDSVCKSYLPLYKEVAKGLRW